MATIIYIYDDEDLSAYNQVALPGETLAVHALRQE